MHTWFRQLWGQGAGFDVSSATVELAAQALGCPPAHIAKTLSFMAGWPAAAYCGGRGCPGGQCKVQSPVSPKGQDDVCRGAGALHWAAFRGRVSLCHACAVQVWLDVSLRRFAEVYPACGSANSAVRLSIPELEELSKPHGLGGRVQGLGVNQDE